MIRKTFFLFYRDHFFKNSSYVMISTFVMAFFGFIFWVIIARMFSTESVGIATTLISSMTLLVNFSDLGFNVSLLRYLPKSQSRDDIINSSFVIVGISGVIASLIFFIGVSTFTPELGFLKTNIIYLATFITFVVALAWNDLIETIFKAYRAAKNILIKNVVLSLLKLLFAGLLLSFGAYGIFSAVSSATVVAFLIGVVILKLFYNYNPRLIVNVNVMKNLARYSAGNYLAGFLYQLPILLLPLVIINYLTAKNAAYYYIDSTILNLLIIIPISITQALLAEGSYNEVDLGKHIKKASLAIAAILVPAVLVSVLFGQTFLLFFGKNYASEAFQLLQLMSISTIFMAITLMGVAFLRIRHRIKLLIISNVFAAAVILSSCIYFLSSGLPGLGWGWLVSQIIVSLMYLIIMLKEFNLLKVFSLYRMK